MKKNQPLYMRAKVILPASRKGLSLMSRAGYWVGKDGRIFKRRNRAANG